MNDPVSTTGVLQDQGFVVWFASSFALAMLSFVTLFVRHMLARDAQTVVRVSELELFQRNALLELAKSFAALSERSMSEQEKMAEVLKEVVSGQRQITKLIEEVIRYVDAKAR